MEIKGVRIQNEANYYKILSVIKNRKGVTAKEVKSLNIFLNSKEESIKTLLEKELKYENKRFSVIRGLVPPKEYYSFFETD